MSILNQQIKQMAYDAATAYLNEGVNLNESIKDMHDNGKIKNDEILKRVCEAANNTVYMTLFKNKNIDRSQIKFPLADSALLLKTIDQESGVMVDDKSIDYLIAPQIEPVIKTAALSDGMEKIAGDMSESAKRGKITYTIQKLAQIDDAARKLVYNLEMIKTASERRSESLLAEYINHGLDTVSARESFADMTKIAMRSVVEDFGDRGVKIIQSVSGHAFEKIASRGFTVNTELTKLSSMNINGDNDLSRTAQELVLELEKAAACKKMITGINSTRSKVKGLRDAVSKK